MIRMPGKSFRGPLPPLGPEEAVTADALKRSVRRLAGEIGERTAFRPEKLTLAASWIEAELRAMGYEVKDEEYRAQGTACRNLWIEIPGDSRSAEIVVVGAHYDSVVGSPGANDNGSGVAALLEIARALRGASPLRTIRLAAFANEEPPFFQTESMGSLVHARAARSRGEAIAAMVSLETLGYYRDEPGSQAYPPPFSLLYPGTGNFIGFVGNFSSRALICEAIHTFRETTSFPSEGGALPGWITGVGWSDHWAFWQIGCPALMVTDTAPFRYPHYHTPADTPEKVDCDRLARVTGGLARVVLALAGRGK